MNAPIDVCERRDVKGIYRRARAGEIGHVTGVDDPYEPPLAPDVGRRTDCETPAESGASVLRAVDLWQARAAGPRFDRAGQTGTLTAFPMLRTAFDRLPPRGR